VYSRSSGACLKLTVDGLRHIKVRHWRTLLAIRRRNGNVTGPARRLTIWSRAGEDVGRSCMPSYPWEFNSPGNAEGRALARPYTTIPHRSFRPAPTPASKCSGPELKANIRGNDNRPADQISTAWPRHAARRGSNISASRRALARRRDRAQRAAGVGCWLHPGLPGPCMSGSRVMTAALSRRAMPGLWPSVRRVHSALSTTFQWQMRAAGPITSRRAGSRSGAGPAKMLRVPICLRHWSSIRPQKCRWPATWRAAPTPEHLLVRVLQPGANLSAGPELKANRPTTEGSIRCPR
jgi:hypothetical protein